MMLREAWEILRSRAVSGYISAVDSGYQGPYDGENRAAELRDGIERIRREFADPSQEMAEMPYSLFLRTEYWENIRRAALMCAGYVCSRCKDTKSELHVHHKTYAHRGRELIFPEDIVVLCKSCHEKEHGLQDRNRKES